MTPLRRDTLMQLVDALLTAVRHGISATEQSRLSTTITPFVVVPITRRVILLPFEFLPYLFDPVADFVGLRAYSFRCSSASR